MKQRNRELEMSERLVPAALLPHRNSPGGPGRARTQRPLGRRRLPPRRGVDLGLILSLRSGGLLVPAIAGADGLTVERRRWRVPRC